MSTSSQRHGESPSGSCPHQFHTGCYRQMVRREKNEVVGDMGIVHTNVFGCGLQMYIINPVTKAT